MNIDNNAKTLKQMAIGFAFSLGTGVVYDLINTVKTMNVSFIYLEDYDTDYINANKLLYKMNPTIYTKHRRVYADNSYYQLNDETSYFIKLKKNNYMKIETHGVKDKSNDWKRRGMKISFFGKNKYKNRELFMRKISKLTSDDRTFIACVGDGYRLNSEVIRRDFDSIILQDHIKNNIVDGLMNWSRSENWYKSNRLVYKIGVFLYGKPGTGKSSIIRAISDKFNNAPIFTINQNNILSSIDSILKIRKELSGVIIVILEDFDMFFKDRNSTDPETEMLQNNNQNLLFQMLDGVHSTDKTIYIATTNHKEKLDPALIRPGRFDIQEELDYIDYEDSLKFMKLFGYDKKVLDALNLEFPIQPSYLQSKVMEYRTKSQLATT
ncbi:MAG: AAA family ATPase [Candidatus Izemoplasmatales bacterium]|nr:AAA family ATPase [Candidatus Izemoplasmatales bacterium]